MVRNAFGATFHIEGDKVVVRNANGEEVFSRSNPAVREPLYEALEILVDDSLHRSTRSLSQVQWQG